MAARGILVWWGCIFNLINVLILCETIGILIITIISFTAGCSLAVYMKQPPLIKQNNLPVILFFAAWRKNGIWRYISYGRYRTIFRRAFGSHEEVVVWSRSTRMLRKVERIPAQWLCQIVSCEKFFSDQSRI